MVVINLKRNLFGTNQKRLPCVIYLLLHAMPKYNIIYTSPNNGHYLWTGTELFTIEKGAQEDLRFSGKIFKQDELAAGIMACKKAAHELFPKDEQPQIKAVEIKVSD